MINRLKKLYPEYIILIKKRKRLYDKLGKNIIKIENIKNKKYIILDKNSYEVHKTINL